jgi:hypothetical protein
MASGGRPTLAQALGYKGARGSTAPAETVSGVGQLPSLKSVLGQAGETKLPTLKDVLSGAATPAPAPKKSGGGILGALEHGAHLVAQKVDLAGHDIKAMPGGLVGLGKLEYDAIKTDVQHPNLGKHESLHDFLHGSNNPASKKLGQAEVGMTKASVTSVEHPLRDPFQTLLTVAPIVSAGAGTVARVGAAGEAAAEGGSLADIAKAAVSKPAVKPRLIQVGDEQVPLTSSHNPAVRAAQRLHDRVVQKALDTNPEGRIAQYGQHRAGSAQDEEARRSQRMAEAPAAALDRAAKRLTSKTVRGQGRVNQAALELTSVNTAPEDAAAYHLAQAEKGVEPARNRVVAKLYQTVHDRGLLTKNSDDDVIVSPNYPKLAEADRHLAKVQGRGDEILARYQVRTPEALQAAKNAPGRYRAGAIYENPTPGKQGVPSQTLLKARAKVDRLQVLHDRALSKLPAGSLGKVVQGASTRTAPVRRAMTESERVAAIRDVLRDPASRATYGGAGARGELTHEAAARVAAIRGGRVTVPTGETREFSSPAGVVTANGGARAERIGAALSVAKDELQRLEEAAAARVKPTGVIGGEAARPGRGHVSYVSSEKRAPQTAVAASPGPVVGEAKAPITSHANQGVNISRGLVSKDITGGASRHFRQILRFQNTTERRNAAIRTGSDVRRSDRDVLVKVPGQEHAKIPQAVEQALGKSKPTVDELAGLHAALEEYRRQLVPGLADGFSKDAAHPVGTPASEAAAERGLEAPEGYKWVDRGALGDLARQSPARAGGIAGKIGRGFDNVNSAITAATVYFKIGHLGTRSLTNAATNIIQGSADPVSIGKSLSLWKSLSDEDKARALAASGQHSVQALPHEGTGRVAQIASKGASWWARRIDSPFRFNAIAYEARKAGFNTPEKFRDLLDKLENPHGSNMSAAERSKVMGVANRANREAIAYDRLSDFEKRYVTRAFWFYPWTSAATRFAVNTLLEHPYKSGALGQAGQIGRNQQAQKLGDLPSYEYGLIPFGGKKVADFSTFSPLATSGDVLEAGARPKQIAGFLNPVYAAANSLINGTTSYGTPSTSPIKDAAQTAVSPMPEAQVLAGFLNRSKDQSRKMFPASPALSGTLTPLLRALLGPGMPRQINVAAAHSSAARERTGR